MANLNIRVNDTLKKQAETIFSELGLSLSVATTIFLKQVVRYNGLPFDMCLDPFYSEQNQTHLAEAKKRIEQIGGTPHELIEINDA